MCWTMPCGVARGAAIGARSAGERRDLAPGEAGRSAADAGLVRRKGRRYDAGARSIRRGPRRQMTGRGAVPAGTTMLGRRRRKLGVTVFKRRKPDDPTCGRAAAGRPDRSGCRVDQVERLRPGSASLPPSHSEGAIHHGTTAISRRARSRPVLRPAPRPVLPPGPVSLSLQSGGVMAPRPGLSPAGPRLARDPAERRTLVVGRGISVQGTCRTPSAWWWRARSRRR